MRENERSNSNHKQETKLISCKKRYEEARQKEQPECADQKHATNKTPLLSDRREDVIVVHRGGGEETEFDLSVRRLESLARPTAGADGNERLIDRPRRASRINLRMNKCGEPLLLIGLQAKVRGQGNRSRDNEQYANQIAKRYSTYE